MALGPVLAAALTNASAHPWSLTVDGNDLLLQGATPGTKTGIPIDTIQVTERGPGGVSSMTFVIEDPAGGGGVTLVDGALVRFWDHTRDSPVFLGYLQRWELVPSLGDVGRAIHVECIGIECQLDWTIIGNTSLPAGMLIQDAVLACCAAGLPDPVLAAGATGVHFWGDEFAGVGLFADTLKEDCDVSGLTLRDAISKLETYTFDETFTKAIVAATIDFHGYLRVWPSLDGNPGTDNQWIFPQGVRHGTANAYYNSIQAWQSGQGTVLKVSARGLRWGRDPGGVMRRLYIKGASGAASGYLSDGTGIAGPGAYISDATITTAQRRNATALNYFSRFAISDRGSFGYVPQAGNDASVFRPHAADIVNIQNTQVGLSGTWNYELGEVRITFTNGLQFFEVSFGGLEASAMAAGRRQTRSTLS